MFQPGQLSSSNIAAEIFAMEVLLLVVNDDVSCQDTTHRVLQRFPHAELYTGSFKAAVNAAWRQSRNKESPVVTNFHRLGEEGKMIVNCIEKQFNSLIICMDPNDKRIQWNGEEISVSAYVLDVSNSSAMIDLLELCKAPGIHPQPNSRSGRYTSFPSSHVLCQSYGFPSQSSCGIISRPPRGHFGSAPSRKRASSKEHSKPTNQIDVNDQIDINDFMNLPECLSSEPSQEGVLEYGSFGYNISSEGISTPTNQLPVKESLLQPIQYELETFQQEEAIIIPPKLDEFANFKPEEDIIVFLRELGCLYVGLFWEIALNLGSSGNDIFGEDPSTFTQNWD